MSDIRRRPAPGAARMAAGPADVLTIEGETVSRFSHQLRSLLTSVGAAADYLLNNDIERGVQDEMLGIICEQATRIDGLLDDFLVVASARPADGRSAAPVNLYQITRQTVRELAGEAQSVGAWLVLDAAGAAPPVVGHHQPLRQAVTAAIRAMISLARPGERVVAQLEEARGSDREKLIQFSVLIQSDDPGLGERADGLRPTDLSLEAVRRICEGHAGSFEMLGDPPGVVCRLPVASMQLGPAAALRPDHRVGACGP